jgi:hypothetical protein
VRIANISWSSVYMIHSSRSSGKNDDRVLLYADVAGVQPSAPAAVVAEAEEIAAALDAAENDARFERLGDFWIDRSRLRHTRSGSTALLTFALSGGRIAMIQVPAEVLQQLQPSRRTGTSGRKPGGRAKAELVGAGA